MTTLKNFVYPIVTVAAVLAATIAHAESPTPTPREYTEFQSGKSRAEVIAEYHRARQDGTLRVWSAQYNPLAAMKADKSRDEVRAEVLASRADAQAFYGEDSGSFALNRNDVRWVSTPTLAAAGGAVNLQ